MIFSEFQTYLSESGASDDVCPEDKLGIVIGY